MFSDGELDKEYLSEEGFVNFFLGSGRRSARTFPGFPENSFF